MRRAVLVVITGGLAFWGIGSGLGHQPVVVGARLTAAITPANAAVTPANTAEPAQAAQSARTGTQTVKFGGYTVSVPASWPVYDLTKNPRQCVRYDVHAVYLGTPGPDQNCPPNLVGRVDTVSIEGATAPAGTKAAGNRKGPLQAGQQAVTPGTIVQDPDLHELALSLPDNAPRIGATYGTTAGTAEQMLATFRPAGATIASPRAGDSIRITGHLVVVQAAGSVAATNPRWPKAVAPTAVAASWLTPPSTPASWLTPPSTPASWLTPPSTPASPSSGSRPTPELTPDPAPRPTPELTPNPAPKHTPKPTHKHTPKPAPKHTPKPAPKHTPKPVQKHTPKPARKHTPKPAQKPTGPVLASNPSPAPTRSAPGRAMAGFDTCAAPALPTMKAWRAKYAAAAIYIGGQMMACGQSNLSASWVRQAEAMGYALMPTFVGLQAPCDGFSGKIDPGNAASQGTAAASQAVSAAKSYGLGAGTPIYYDMEAYDHTNAGCRTAVLAFLDAWTRQLKTVGYISGVYSSADAAITDLQSATTVAGHPLAEPQAIWFALWDNNPRNLNGTPYMTSAVWPAASRSKQYAGNRTVTVGGISLSIDADWVASAVARG